MRLVFFGAPGAGKGTMAEHAVKDFGLPHISTGDIFRAAIRDKTALGLKVQAVIESGGLVSDELTIDLVQERLARSDSRQGWLLDGFPRTMAQAEALSLFCPEDYVIDLEVSDAKVIERISGRRSCKQCGSIYHVTNMPPAREGLCDLCGGTLHTRDDDKEEAVMERLNHYKKQTLPLVDYYKKRGTLIPVDGSGEAEAVWAVIKAHVQALTRA